MALHMIDVSNHQPDIDFRAVPCDAVVLKATEGKGARDRVMPRHVREARAAGKPLGFYHFVSQGNTPEQEAQNFIDYVRPYLQPADMICLDWEPILPDGRPGTNPAPDWVWWAQRWLQIVEPALGRRPWFYTQLSTANMTNWQDIAANNPLWLAQYPGSNKATGYNPAGQRGKLTDQWKNLAAWQFTDGGRLPGYSADLDLNELYTPWWANHPREETVIDIGQSRNERIAVRWAEMGGPKSALGNPTGPEVRTEKGAFRPFDNGVMIYSDELQKAFENRGAIREKYAEYGYEYGKLGFPTSDEKDAKDGGRFQEFQGGAIYWHPDTGAHAIYGRIRDKWGELNWEHGQLGFPIGDEFDGAKPGGRVQLFRGGVMYWTLDGDAHPVWGAMLEQYGLTAYEAGRWGYPVGDEVNTGRGWTQQFEGGQMLVGAPGPAVAKELIIPTIREADPKVWIQMPGGSGWGCTCMQLTLPLIEKEMKRRGLIKNNLDFFQFGYNAGGVAASAGTHDMGGVIDTNQYSREQRQCWADFGVMPFPRIAQFGWNGDPHGHGVWHGCVHRTQSAANQCRDGINGLSGLVGNRRYDFIHPTRTWQDALRAL